MDALKLEHDLSDAYSALSGWIRRQVGAEQSLMRAQLVLEEERARYLTENDPKDLGANEEQRRAKLNFLCKQSYEAVQDAEIYRIEVRGDVEVARLRVERLRAQLRILELQAGIQRAA